VVVRWAARRVRGGHRFRSAAARRGHTAAGGLAADLPAPLAGLEILQAPADGSRSGLGVICDRGEDTYTALLQVGGAAFALLESGDKRRLLSAWDEVLRGLGGADSPIHRLQWVERTVPDDGDALGRDLRARRVAAADSASVRSYVAVLDDAGPVSTHHEVLLAVQLTPRRAARAMRRTRAGKDEAACRVLAEQVARLARRLHRADVRVLDGGLSPRMVARALRLAVDPAARPQLSRRALHHPDAAGVEAANAWPLAADTSWRWHRTDSAVHATYWIAEWPRVPVGPDFLAPLLLFTGVHRTVAVTMEPVGQGLAIREAEHARTTELADQQLRESKGFLTTHRKRREQQGIERRAAELQEGYAEYRFAGYVTVTAGDLDALESACAEVEHAAQQSGLELRRLVGEQDDAFTYTLPLARGVS
jgi:hypothetical protein